MDPARAIRFLQELQLFGARPGLRNTRRLAELAGHPEHDLRFLHVAGTNGKGSVAALLADVYQASGLKVGLFTSPHLIRFNERIQINRRSIDDEAFVALVREFRHHLKVGADRGWWPDIDGAAPGSAGGHPTFFEVATVLAARHFANEKCDLVIWETGLGGRLDATNIVTPVASVITNVSVEHSSWLGHRVEQVAAEKSGIIKPGVPVFAGTTDPAVLRVLREVAGSRNAPFFTVDETTARRVDPNSRLAKVPFLRRNAALALTVVDGLQKTFPVNDTQLNAGLAAFHWPGRLHEARFGDRTLIIDGAHNPAGAAALVEALSALYPGQLFRGVVGMLKDKNQAGYFRELAPLLAGCSLVPIEGPRGLPVDQLAAIAKAAAPGIAFNTFASLSDALAQPTDGTPTLVTGSLYLVGEALALLEPPATGSQAALNDWHDGSNR